MRHLSRHPVTRITRRQRALFERLFKQVLHTLPAAARDLLQTMPVAVDDYPSAEVQDEMDVAVDELFGLYTGTPATERSLEQVGVPEAVIHIYRLALLSDAMNRSGRVDQRRLRRQIRTTLLHELGHHHGFDEDKLDRLGY